MSFTVEMDIGKGVLAIDRDYNFIRAKRNKIGGAVLINIAGQPAHMNALGPHINALGLQTQLLGKILGRCKYNAINQNLVKESLS